ncbi:hypothetical protein A3L04_07250 [Thermococcus chitonophagus]|uniref:CARDB domain-containing protein n=1 Tax=Thermococcus chitonophagus TaxID=54262 RepID=A0A170SPZ6_9EURY|nr:Ig-like domain-containing protein [Thermococcus chitonophagus]ASJ16883.1 hypothetical protein A3L04_07250 [Thermococcus chitonophagus]CUX78364.1 hypothetical protein CHITON_1585 [Thermococcus chitonophagus]
MKVMSKAIISCLVALALANVVIAQPILVLTVYPKEIEGKPGDIVSFNVLLKNVGNSSAENVTVFVFDRIKGILFTQGFIKNIPPNTTANITLKAYLLKPEAGVYTIKIVGRVGNYLSEDYLRLKVRSVINYTLGITGERKIVYGNNASLTLSINSNSNVLLYGDAKLIIMKDGRVLKVLSYKPMIEPWGYWRKRITLQDLKIGNYTAIFTANFYNRIKNTTFHFEVFRRPLKYRAYFLNGNIIVEVTEKEKPVEGIKVRIGNETFYTDENGIVKFPVSSPGTYVIWVDLDGLLSQSVITVEKPIIVPSIENSTLLVRVFNSVGDPLSNITVKVSSQKGEFYNITDSNGTCLFNLKSIGYGMIKIETISSRYLPSEYSLEVKPPVQKPTTSTTPTPTQPPTTTNTKPQKTETGIATSITTTPTPEKTGIDKVLVALLLSFAVILSISSYIAFFRPIIVEDNVGKYHFIRVKAPRFIPLKNFTYEKLASVKEVWAEKGDVKVEGNKVVWHIEELEPGEEATLHMILA